MNNIIEKQLKECGIPKCYKFYQNNITDINNILDKYKNLLPLLFVQDLPEINNNTFAEIINRDEFDGLCLKCCWYIVQSYNYNEKTLFERYFTSPTKFSKKSLCFN